MPKLALFGPTSGVFGPNLARPRFKGSANKAAVIGFCPDVGGLAPNVETVPDTVLSEVDVQAVGENVL